MIKRFYTILCVLIIGIGMFRIAYAQEVSIPDPNLAAVVRSAIELPPETPITQQLLLQLTRLNGKNSEIDDLTGLEHATNLTNINLNTNQISDLTPLAGLTQLKSLSLGFNQISDLTPLAGLTSLSTLRLHNNQISDLTPLAGLTQLEELLLGANRISILVPLHGLTNLVELDLESNQIKIVTPLKALAELETLLLSHNRINSIKPLTTLTNLEVLKIEDNPLTDISQIHELIASGVEVDFDTAVPYKSQVALTRVLFNEIRNASADKNDWIELRNISNTDIPLQEWEISLLTREGDTVNRDIDVVQFPDYTLPVGDVLLITNTDPSETTLLRGQNISTPDMGRGAPHDYLVAEELILPSTPYLLILRSVRNRNGTQEAVEDVAGTYFHERLTSDQPLAQGTAWQRASIGSVGYAVEAWDASGYQAGIGYQPAAPKDTSPGTPGYHNDALVNESSTGQISISEVMFTNAIGDRSVQQWIELYNRSATEGVDLTGWDITIEARHGQRHKHVVFELRDLHVLPRQTVLLVSGLGASRRSKNILDGRVYSVFLQHAAEFLGHFSDGKLLSRDGLFLQVSTPEGVVVDVIGNLDGDSETRDAPMWALPAGITENGSRSSMLRRYRRATRLPFVGTEASSWRSAVEVKLGESTYFGDARDVGSPGYTLGGVLAVALSHFRVEWTVEGVVIKWATESELDNAGFNILRSDSESGPFQVVNATLIRGAGTTGERRTYTWTDTTARPDAVYYYQIEDVSFAGVRDRSAAVRVKGHISAGEKLRKTWGSLKRNP